MNHTYEFVDEDCVHQNEHILFGFQFSEAPPSDPTFRSRHTAEDYNPKGLSHGNLVKIVSRNSPVKTAYRIARLSRHSKARYGIILEPLDRRADPVILGAQETNLSSLSIKILSAFRFKGDTETVLKNINTSDVIEDLFEVADSPNDFNSASIIHINPVYDDAIAKKYGIQETQTVKYLI